MRPTHPIETDLGTKKNEGIEYSWLRREKKKFYLSDQKAKWWESKEGSNGAGLWGVVSKNVHPGLEGNCR